MIHYLCPEVKVQSAGLRILYRHVEILCQHGIEAGILHTAPGFHLEDMPKVPTRDLKTHGAIQYGDTVVFPEGLAALAESFKSYPLKLVVMAMSWQYIYSCMPDFKDFRSYNYRHVISNSPHIADFVSWSMGLPTSLFSWGLNSDLYFHEPEKKVPQIVYIERKKEEVGDLIQMLHSRNPDYVTKIKWVGLKGLTQTAYAQEVRNSQVFLNLSRAEGLPCSLLEAMRSGTFVAGYNSVGGQRQLIGSGDHQNCILAENLDFITLGQRLEPMLQSILGGDMTPWETIRQNAIASTAPYTAEAEIDSVLRIWKRLLEEFSG